jgi:hypothetical protein
LSCSLQLASAGFADGTSRLGFDVLLQSDILSCSAGRQVIETCGMRSIQTLALLAAAWAVFRCSARHTAGCSQPHR